MAAIQINPGLLLLEILIFFNSALETSAQNNVYPCETFGLDVANLTKSPFWYLDINDTEACSLPVNKTIDSCRFSFAVCNPLPRSPFDCYNCTAAFTSDYDDQYKVGLGTYRADINHIVPGSGAFIIANGIGNISSYLTFNCNTSITWDYKESLNGNKIPESAYRGIIYSKYSDGITYTISFGYAGACDNLPTVEPTTNHIIPPPEKKLSTTTLVLIILLPLIALFVAGMILCKKFHFC